MIDRKRDTVNPGLTNFWSERCPATRAQCRHARSVPPREIGTTEPRLTAGRAAARLAAV
jgi:hypothetical protein